MTTYELLIIHNALLSDSQYQDQLTRLKDVLTRNGAEIRLEDVWGKRRLAYMIGKQREGYYALFHFDTSSTTSCLAELERFCKIEETVLRHLVTRAVLNKSLGQPPEHRDSEEGEGHGRRGRFGSEGEGRFARRREPAEEVGKEEASLEAPETAEEEIR